MQKKLDSKLVTGEVQQIKQQLELVQLNPQLKKVIDKNVFLIQSELKDVVTIKKTGSYATNCIYNFDEKIEVDLLALKYVNRQMYAIYNEEIQNKDHFSDCWVCEINELIYQRLVHKTRNNPNVNVEWNTTK
ncbi:hypothetical protein SCLARK_001405 [Spiroplasma clarkii]|nr:hypothetical protein [Spiroplasma clarkii]ARU91930.1 hypothetical protein SCLARK_001405 [Spiroplasma clarkii]